MPTCPECNEEINSLRVYELHEAEFAVSVDNTGCLWPEYDDKGIKKETWYECPTCRTKLFDAEDDAAEFLLQE